MLAFINLKIIRRFAPRSVSKAVTKVFHILKRHVVLCSRIISYIWSNFAHREKLNVRKIRFFRARPFCDDRGISACRIFSPVAADCEMKFYIKLGVFSLYLFLSHSASLSPLVFFLFSHAIAFSPTLILALYVFTYR